ncbi:MAG: DNA alkylation repair protein [Bacteroidales bacterium]|nr:DNA alkylation repair protein [Bacteroidales bacterium]
MNTIITKIRKELEDISDIKTRDTSQHFFKEPVKTYGVKSALVHKISKEYFKTFNNKTKSELFELCDTLWQSGYLEESIIACNWSYFIHKDYKPDDFIIFEKWVDSYVTNWAACDTLCNHTLGAFIEKYPEYLSRLKIFATSENRWKRRAAGVSLIIPARKGKFLTTILEIADILLTDQDDMVQKGYGWMLKAASPAHQKEIFEYVMQNKSVMPRTALRYAIEKMPNELKTKAMER